MDKMPRRRNSFQMKEQDKVTARNLSRTDTSNMPDGKFQITIIRIFAGLEKRLDLTLHLKELQKEQKT